MDSFIARQPIFDIHMNVYAYELLYRSDAVRNSFDMRQDMDSATARVVMDSFYDIGLERMTGGKKAFVNFTENLLECGMATLFSSQSLVVEVLETVSPSDSMLEQLNELRGMGYQIALDDYEYSPDRGGLLALADIVKVDFKNMDAEQIDDVIAHTDLRRTRLLAEKVETTEEFERAKSLGFTLFQGYFFAMPSIFSGGRIEPAKVPCIRLMQQAWQMGDLDYRRLAETIKQDMALSYKMLRMINSAYYTRRYRIRSIHHALVMLGDAEIRKWASLVAMVGISKDRTDELVRESLARARFLELYAIKRRLSSNNVEWMFLSGLLSMIDVVMRRPMDELIAQLAAPNEVERTLVLGEGAAALLLKLFHAFGRGDWSAAKDLCADLPGPLPNLSALYLEAIDWGNAILAAS